MKLRHTISIALMALGLNLAATGRAAAASAPLLRELPDRFVVRGEAGAGYTVEISRVDGRLLLLACNGERFTDGAAAPLLQVAAGTTTLIPGKPAGTVICQQVASTTPETRITVPLDGGRTLTYHCQGARLGISLTGTNATATFTWNSPDVVYDVKGTPVFSRWQTTAVMEETVSAWPQAGKACVTFIGLSGRTELGPALKTALTEKPLWLALRPVPAGYASPLLRLAAVFQHDTDEGTFSTPHPQDFVLVDQLLLAPRAALTARFTDFGPKAVLSRMKDPRATVFALAITDGDAQLVREGRHQWPGMYATLQPPDWQKLATTMKERVITADTAALPPGVYRVRVAFADGTEPAWNKDLYTEDVYVVISDSPVSLDVTLPENRQAYYRGETIALALLVRARAAQAAGTAEFRLQQGANPVGKPFALRLPEVGPRKQYLIEAGLSLPGTPERHLRDWRGRVALNTADLAPGSYTVEVMALGQTVSRTFDVVEPEPASRIAISENQIPGAPFANTLMGSPFGGAAVDSLAHELATPYADLQITSLRNELAQGTARLVNTRLAATLATINAGPAAERIGVYDLRQLWLDGMLRQHAGYWQGVQGRALSFSKANTLPGTEDAVRARLAATARDYHAYPNFFGPQVDVDCGAVRAADQLAWTGIPEPMVKAFRDRLAAAQGPDRNADWFRGVWARTDARDRAMLALVDPTQSVTANREYHHGTVAGGQYAPALYAGLDLTHVEAWGDALDNALFADCWANVGVAARRANNRPGQPVWIETQAYHAEVPGYLQTRWWGALANGADGVGYAANVFGLRQWSGIEPHRADFKRQTAAAMARLVHTLGPALNAAVKEPAVALLFSKTEGDARGHDYGLHCFGAQPPFVSFFALAMAGYQPDFVLEEDLLTGKPGVLANYPVLYLTAQTRPLPVAVDAAIRAYAAQGGKIVMDADSATTAYPSALRVDVKPATYKGPHAFGGPEDWAWIDTAVPKLRAALEPLVKLPGRAADKRCVTYWRQHGDTLYATVINESYAPLQTTLDLTQAMGGYDLLNGKRLEPAAKHGVDLRQHAVRILAFIPQPVSDLSVHATATAKAGDTVGVRAFVTGGLSKRLPTTTAPATIAITGPGGETRWTRHGTIGADSAAFVWQTAATDVPGNYTVTVTSWLDGKTASCPLRLTAGRPRNLWAAPEAAPVSISAMDRRSLASLKTQKDRHWCVILDTAQLSRRAPAEKLARAFGRLGHTAFVWDAPEWVRMPVGYLFTPEQQAARDTVFAGKAIGERYYLHGHDGDKSAPYAETWEPRNGTAIHRNVILFGRPGENRLLDEFGPAAGPASVTVGVGVFSGDHSAVFIRGDTEEDLARAIDTVLDTKGAVDELIGPEAARLAFKAGYGLQVSGLRPPDEPRLSERPNLTRGQTPVTWAEQLGRPVKQILLSPNGQHLLAKHHGIPSVLGQYSLDGKLERVLTRPNLGDTGDDDVRGIDNDGGLVLADGSVLKLGGELTPAAGPPPLWRSANGEEQLQFEPYTTEERKDGKTEKIKHQRLVRLSKGQRLYASEALGDAPGGLVTSPNGKYLWQASDGAGRDQHLGKRTVTLYDALTGRALWTKSGWWVFNSAWSPDGEALAVTRHYPNVDRHGLWPEPANRFTVSLVRAKDGELLCEGNPTTKPGRVEIGAGNGFVIAWPEFVASHYWLIKPGQDIQKVEASARWVYSGCLAANGAKLFVLDMDGVLWCLQPNGVMIWTNGDHQKAAGPDLGFLTTCGDDLLLGTATGKLVKITWRNGAPVWTQVTASHLN